MEVTNLLEMLITAGFLALVANRIVEGLVAPLRQKFPLYDFWWLIYVSWVIGGLLGWASTLNLFAEWIPDATIGRILTAIVIGGGANLIRDIFYNTNSTPPAQG